MVQGRIFIDRDPKRFALILNYLRDGTCVLPADSLGIEEVLQEAEFYQVLAPWTALPCTAQSPVHDRPPCLATALCFAAEPRLH